jgi:hypothetical protein
MHYHMGRIMAMILGLADAAGGTKPIRLNMPQPRDDAADHRGRRAL